MDTPSLIFRFGPFEARTCAQELSKNGTPVRLRGQPFAILELLLSRAGAVVTREEIQEKLWPADTFVDFEHGLNTSIKKLRQVLCDSATEPRYIETLPRLGYRFIAPVETVVEPGHRKAAGGAGEVPAAGESGNAIAAQRSEAGVFLTREHGRGRPRLHLLLSAIVVLAGVAL